MSYELATIEQVRVILPTGSLLTDPQLQASIDAAACSVEQVGASCSVNLSDSCLTQVHIYLSAHYSAATENTLSLSSEKDACSDSSATYGFKFGEGIKGTPFGQMANTLSCGYLVTLDQPAAAFFSLGTI